MAGQVGPHAQVHFGLNIWMAEPETGVLLLYILICTLTYESIYKLGYTSRNKQLLLSDDIFYLIVAIFIIKHYFDITKINICFLLVSLSTVTDRLYGFTGNIVESFIILTHNFNGRPDLAN